jgi:predicted DNA binding protein
MLQVTFRIRRGRGFSKVSAAFPRSRLLLWCNLRTDVVEVQSPDGRELAAVRKAIGEMHEAAEGFGELGTGTTLVLRCPTRPGNSVMLAVEEHGGVFLPPIVVQGGWDTFRMFLPEKADLRRLMASLEALGTVEILGKARTAKSLVEEQFMLPAGTLLGSLTRRQSEAILVALRHGYYNVPRTASMKDVAARAGRPRTTMEEHVRKGESKVLAALAPYLALRLHEGPGPGRPPMSRQDAWPPAAGGRPSSGSGSRPPP